MKSPKKVLLTMLACILIFASFLGLNACGKTPDVVTMWIGGSIVGEDELEQPQDSWIISRLLKQYEEENGVEIELTYFEDEDAMVQLIANNGRNGNEVPDIACIYSSGIIRDMADVIYPVTQYVTDEEKQDIMFWETVTKNGNQVSEADEILGYPIGGTEVTFIAYNKAIFKEANIDAENNPPKTFDDFYRICEKLYNFGVTPIVASDGGWNELYLQVFAKRWVQYSSNSEIIDIANGNSLFADDTALIESLNTAREYYSEGFINSDYATNSDATTLFANGKGAMFSCSNYDLKLLQGTMGDNLGVFLLPDYEGDVVYPHISFGGCNQCLSVFKNSNHKEEAVKIIKWLSNKDNNIKMVQAYGCFPNRSDISLGEYDKDPSEILQKIYPLLPYAHSTPDYLMPMKVYSEFYRYSLSAIIGQITVEEFADKMDETTHN